MKIRIKKIPTFTFGERISEILEGCELTVQTGEEDSSLYLRDPDRILREIDHFEFSYIEVTDSIRRKNHGDELVKEFNSIYTGKFGLMSLNNPIIFVKAYFTVVD